MFCLNCLWPFKISLVKFTHMNLFIISTNFQSFLGIKFWFLIPEKKSLKMRKKNNTFEIPKSSKRKCIYCDDETHFSLTFCRKFLDFSPNERSTIIRNSRLCSICFGKNKILQYTKRMHFMS